MITTTTQAMTAPIMAVLSVSFGVLIGAFLEPVLGVGLSIQFPVQGALVVFVDEGTGFPFVFVEAVVVVGSMNEGSGDLVVEEPEVDEDLDVGTIGDFAGLDVTGNSESSIAPVTNVDSSNIIVVGGIVTIVVWTGHLKYGVLQSASLRYLLASWSPSSKAHEQFFSELFSESFWTSARDSGVFRYCLISGKAGGVTHSCDDNTSCNRDKQMIILNILKNICIQNL